MVAWWWLVIVGVAAGSIGCLVAAMCAINRK